MNTINRRLTVDKGAANLNVAAAERSRTFTRYDSSMERPAPEYVLAQIHPVAMTAICRDSRTSLSQPRPSSHTIPPLQQLILATNTDTDHSSHKISGEYLYASANLSDSVSWNLPPLINDIKNCYINSAIVNILCDPIIRGVLYSCRLRLKCT